MSTASSGQKLSFIKYATNSAVFNISPNRFQLLIAATILASLLPLRLGTELSLAGRISVGDLLQATVIVLVLGNSFFSNVKPPNLVVLRRISLPLALWVALALFFSLRNQESLELVVTLGALTYFFTTLISGLQAPRLSLKFLRTAVMSGLTLAIVLGLFSFLTSMLDKNSKVDGLNWALMGLFPNPNHTAAWICLALIFLFATRTSMARHKQVLEAVLLMAGVLYLGFLQSDASFGALIIGVAFVSAFNPGTSKKRILSVLGFGTLTLLIFFPGSYISGGLAAEALARVNHELQSQPVGPSQEHNFGTVIPLNTNPVPINTNPVPLNTNPVPINTNPVPTSYSGRLLLWKEAVSKIQTDPMIGDPSNSSIRVSGYPPMEVHNEFLNQVLTWGLLGLLCMAWFLVSIWRFGGLPTHAMILSILVLSAANNTASWRMLWLFLGLALVFDLTKNYRHKSGSIK
jgi:hypothetical protein